MATQDVLLKLLCVKLLALCVIPNKPLYSVRDVKTAIKSTLQCWQQLVRIAFSKEIMHPYLSCLKESTAGAISSTEAMLIDVLNGQM